MMAIYREYYTNPEYRAIRTQINNAGKIIAVTAAARWITVYGYGYG